MATLHLLRKLRSKITRYSLVIVRPAGAGLRVLSATLALADFTGSKPSYPDISKLYTLFVPLERLINDSSNFVLSSQNIRLFINN